MKAERETRQEHEPAGRGRPGSGRSPAPDRAALPGCRVSRDRGRLTRAGRGVGRSRARAARLAAALGVAAVLLAFPKDASGQYSVRPVLHHYPAGQKATRVSTVKNEGDAPQELRLYVADFDRDREGEHRFLEAGEHRRSCADRVRVFPGRVRIEPGGSADVRITVRPASRTCWSVVFVETLLGDRQGVRIGQRIGVKIFGHGSGARRDASVDSVTATPAGGSVEVAFSVRNSGEIPVRPAGSVEIRSLTGDVVAKTEVPPFGVLPGHTRRVRAEVEADLAGGRYVAVPILDVGADYLLGGQAPLRIPAAGATARRR